jgi:hypothetical protein
MSSVAFHVTNFHQFIGATSRGEIEDKSDGEFSVDLIHGRISFEADGWKITLDAHSSTVHLVQELKDISGNAITHVGRIARVDDTEFRPHEVKAMLSILSDYLSFARGAYCPPILCVGFNAQNERVWEDWTVPKMDSWSQRDSWFPTNNVKAFEATYPEFVRLRKEPDFGNQLSLAVEWYVQANRDALVDTAIVLSQVALELLAYAVIDDRERRIDPGTFKLMPAADKIRLLLWWAGISLDIPASKLELLRIAGQSERQWRDGPQAITVLRNCTVHPNEWGRQVGVSVEAKIETRDVGLWYLDLCLLKLMNYKGQYRNRCSNAIESVPWM